MMTRNYKISLKKISPKSILMSCDQEMEIGERLLVELSFERNKKVRFLGEVSYTFKNQLTSQEAYDIRLDYEKISENDIAVLEELTASGDAEKYVTQFFVAPINV